MDTMQVITIVAFLAVVILVVLGAARIFTGRMKWRNNDKP